jgi:hypothetical protein
MSEIQLDIAEFRSIFPAFSSVGNYSEALLNHQWGFAICYLSPDACADCRKNALYLLLAHLLYLNDLISSGETAGFVQSAGIDKVSVSYAAPQFGSDMFKYWLSLSPYGLQLLALLKKQSAGGFYVGGRRELSAFRKVRGRF